MKALACINKIKVAVLRLRFSGFICCSARCPGRHNDEQVLKQRGRGNVYFGDL